MNDEQPNEPPGSSSRIPVPVPSPSSSLDDGPLSSSFTTKPSALRARTSRSDVLSEFVLLLEVLIFFEIAGLFYKDTATLLFVVRVVAQLQSALNGAKPIVVANAIAIASHVLGSVSLPTDTASKAAAAYTSSSPSSSGRESADRSRYTIGYESYGDLGFGYGNGYLQGSIIVDFVGEIPVSSRWTYLIYDLLILTLQVLCVVVRYKRDVIVADGLTASRTSATGAEGQSDDSTTGANTNTAGGNGSGSGGGHDVLQDLDAEEAGISRRYLYHSSRSRSRAGTRPSPRMRVSNRATAINTGDLSRRDRGGPETGGGGGGGGGGGDEGESYELRNLLSNADNDDEEDGGRGVDLSDGEEEDDGEEEGEDRGGQGKKRGSTDENKRKERREKPYPIVRLDVHDLRAAIWNASSLGSSDGGGGGGGESADAVRRFVAQMSALQAQRVREGTLVAPASTTTTAPAVAPAVAPTATTTPTADTNIAAPSTTTEGSAANSDGTR